jgi:hypothetical protein
MTMTIGNLAFSSVLKTKFDRLYTILQKNGGTDTKPIHGQTEPQFLSDPMSDRKKKFSILKWPGTLQGQIYW